MIRNVEYSFLSPGDEMMKNDRIIGDVSVARATRSFARERGAFSFIRRRRASGVSESESRWRRR
mgnify:CR=1 FL=1